MLLPFSLRHPDVPLWGREGELKRMCASDSYCCSSHVFGPTLLRGSNTEAGLQFGIHTVPCTLWQRRAFQAHLYVFLWMLSMLMTVMIFPIICSSNDASVQPQINRNPARMLFYFFSRAHTQPTKQLLRSRWSHFNGELVFTLIWRVGGWRLVGWFSKDSEQYRLMNGCMS